MLRMRIIEARSGAAGSGQQVRWPLLMGCLIVIASGCTTGRYTTSSDNHSERLTHRLLGYSIAQPGWVGSADWRSIEIEGADLAYGSASGAVISLSSNCSNSRATPAVLARQVTIGTERSTIYAAGPFEVAGAEGWSQSFDTVEDGVPLHVKAVTVVAGACVYDWLLVERDPVAFESIEPAFDAWVGSFLPPQAPPDAAPGESKP